MIDYNPPTSHEPEVDSALTDFIDAVTGGEDHPALYRLTWLSALLAEIDASSYVADHIDPSAALECLSECRELARKLRTAVAKAEKARQK